MGTSTYKAVFTDVGGVIATNGWDTELRKKMVKHSPARSKSSGKAGTS